MKTGVYRHFKGELYVVSSVAQNTENGQQFVVYRDKNGKVWCREKEMFLASVEHDGCVVARFELMREVKTSNIQAVDLMKMK